MYCGASGLQRGLKSPELKVGYGSLGQDPRCHPDSKGSVRVTEAGDAR